MNESPELPFDEGSKRNTFRWQAYLSSALTLPDEHVRVLIKTLNAKIRDCLQSRCDTFVYLPQEYSDPSRDDSMSPAEIYLLDRWRIAESDFFLANLDQPSFGVGQEVEIAAAIGMPIIAFHYSSYSPSRMIKGAPVLFVGDGLGVPAEHVIKYKELDHSDLLDNIVAKSNQVQKYLKTPLREEEFDTLAFSELLKKRLKNSSITLDVLSDKTGLSIAFLKHLSSDFETIHSTLQMHGLLQSCRMRNIPLDRFLNPGLWVLKEIAAALDCRISELLGEDELDRIWQSPILKASERGVTLGDFVQVSNDCGYQIMYRKAALFAQSSSEFDDIVAEQIVEAAGKLK